MVYYALGFAALVAVASAAPVQDVNQLERRTFGLLGGHGGLGIHGNLAGKHVASVSGSGHGLIGGILGSLAGKGQGSASIGASGSGGIKADASLAGNVVVGLEAKLPSICAGVKARLQGGAGVRVSLKSECKAQVGLDLTDADVMAIVKGIASIGASINADAEISADAGVSGSVYGAASAKFSAGLDAMVSASGNIKGSIDSEAEFGLGALFGGLLTAGVSGALDGSVSLAGSAGAQFHAALSANAGINAGVSVSGTAGVGALLCGLKQIGGKYNGKASVEIGAFFTAGGQISASGNAQGGIEGLIGHLGLVGASTGGLQAAGGFLGGIVGHLGLGDVHVTPGSSGHGASAGVEVDGVQGSTGYSGNSNNSNDNAQSSKPSINDSYGSPATSQKHAVKPAAEASCSCPSDAMPPAPGHETGPSRHEAGPPGHETGPSGYGTGPSGHETGPSGHEVSPVQGSARPSNSTGTSPQKDAPAAYNAPPSYNAPSSYNAPASYRA
jgi:hypothetical protein